MQIKKTLKICRNYSLVLLWRIFYSLKFVGEPVSKVKFVVEDRDWAIQRVGESIGKKIESFSPNCFNVATRSFDSVNQVVHFGSQYMWLDWANYLPSSNMYAVSFFHGKREDGPHVSKHIDDFIASTPKISKIIISSTIIRKRLVDWGIPDDKIVYIPIGVDTDLFVPAKQFLREKTREALGLPKDAIVIGSFQKDGNGWGSGDTPKLIKGPDLFVEALLKLKNLGLPVVALLTGPARGYVTNRLKEVQIPFIHKYVKDYTELPALYQALDIYMVTSREEGGPMGLIESMASGIPVVSTRVGMAPDLIENRVSGILAEVEDVEALVEGVVWLIKNSALSLVGQSARKSALRVDWEHIAAEHWQKIYEPLIKAIHSKNL